MPAILLVDNDEAIWVAVRLAMEPGVDVHVVRSLAEAFSFLRKRSQEICGVIVDLNLTGGTDNFGRELLERLREIAMPCVVFSAYLSSPEDAQRYENEFGVLGTISKMGAGVPGKNPLEELRDCVERMIAASVEQLRERVQAEFERELERLDGEIERERNRSDNLIAETQRVAGSGAARKLDATETARIEKLINRVRNMRSEFVSRVGAAATMEDLKRLRTDILNSLEAK